MKIDFCFPVYNENEIFEISIKKTIQYFEDTGFEFEWSVVYIVNGSSDDFIELVKNVKEKYDKNIKFVIYPEKGKGRSIKRYFSESNADILTYMDIDLSTSLEHIPSLIYPIINGEADLVIGSRLLSSSSNSRFWFRNIVSKTYIFLSKMILSHNFTDLQCGFKAIQKTVWQKVSKRIEDNDYFFDTEFVYFAYKLGYGVKEIPVNWIENRYITRRSKINVWKEGLRFLFKLMELKRRRQTF